VARDGIEPPGDTPSLEELKRQRDELSRIVDAIPAFVLYKGRDNRIRRVNRAVAEALGLRSTENVEEEVERWHASAAARYRDADLEVLASGRAKLGSIEQLEIPRLGKRWFETDRLPELDAEGNVVAMVVVAQDITDRKQLEERLLQAQKLESIGRLAGGVAHDFNNLLTSVFGLITLAQRAMPKDSMAHEYLSLLQLTAEGGANLTKQLLAFARRQVIEPKVLDLNVVVLETATLLERVLGENIDVRAELAQEPLPVKVDANQISQLILNLALNARDAMPTGGKLSIGTGRVVLDGNPQGPLPGVGDGAFAVLTVRDTGHGLSEDARAHLFEPFYTTKAFGKGTGLGLAMCYGIVKQNQGHITVDSKLGSGTTFMIYLPEVEAELEPAKPARTSEPVQAGHETLLFVEDDDLVRNLLVSELASQGYRLIAASNGEEALRAAEEHPGEIHLLITDLVMPKMGGTELARRFREIRPRTPVLFISGYTQDMLKDGEQGVHLLEKPFTHEALFQRIRVLLEGSGDPSVRGSTG
jgi:two-component system cell cycle sensor histidine kinase/response regulator CckA